jgi:hypothetical protein
MTFSFKIAPTLTGLPQPGAPKTLDRMARDGRTGPTGSRSTGRGC